MNPATLTLLRGLIAEGVIQRHQIEHDIIAMLERGDYG
jgi:hypothetical protein